MFGGDSVDNIHGGLNIIMVREQILILEKKILLRIEDHPFFSAEEEMSEWVPLSCWSLCLEHN